MTSANSCGMLRWFLMMGVIYSSGCSLMFQPTDTGDDAIDLPTDSVGGDQYHVAVSQELKRGRKVSGTLESSYGLDGENQVFESENVRGRQRFEHHWSFANLPSNTPLTMELVGDFDREFRQEAQVTIAVDGVTVDLSPIDLDGEVHYEAEIGALAGADLEIRIETDFSNYGNWRAAIDTVRLRNE